MRKGEAAAIVLLLLALLAIGLMWPAPHAAGDTPARQLEALVFEPVEVVRSSGGPSASGQTSTPSAAPSAPKPSPAPSARVASQSAAGNRPAPVAAPKAAVRVPTPPVTGLQGVASWYRYVEGGAAAGPALRSALGPGWRGMSVAVCRTDGGAMACVRVTLSDFMRADRLIDLDSRSFAALMPLSRGLVTVEVVP